MKISEALKNVSEMAIDTAPFIYFVERHPSYFDRVTAIFQLIDNNQFSAFSSVITLTEVLNKPLRDKDDKLVLAYKTLLLAGDNLRLVRVTESIAEQAAELRAQYLLRTPDSIQIASALALNCDSFLTNDFGLRRVKELKVLVLDDLKIDPPIEEQSPK